MRSTRTLRIGLAALLLALASTTAPSSAAPAGSPISVSGLVRVEVDTYQSLPPPYKPGHRVLTSNPALAAFAKAVTSHRIAIRQHPTASSGCTGGVEYTIVVRTNVRRTTLSAYRCAGTITGNLTGEVAAFLRDLGSI